MSRFFASIQGDRGETTRKGNTKSGINGHVCGWHIGAHVSCVAEHTADADMVEVRLTGGSNQSRQHPRIWFRASHGPDGYKIHNVEVAGYTLIQGTCTEEERKALELTLKLMRENSARAA